MSYKGLARKYRPSSFAELLGHEALVTTLSNAIVLNRLPHAILLTGTRGIGKTTTARIIAKSLNCLEQDQPIVQSCSKCNQCLSIAQGNNQDVLEIDAASHTGVQDIRELIENAKYRPIYSRYKVYIIDEVHMLSNSAFNALLKTLEEPPSHAKFILATTEIRKIPLTIISRCQRFTLRKMSEDKLRAHYHNIIQKEGYTAEEEAIHIIAKAADGSVRDGLSMLDQAMAIASTTNRLLTSSIQEMIGCSEEEVIFEMLAKVIEGDLAQALVLARKLYKEGADLNLAIQGLLEQVYHIILAKVLQNNSQNNEENSKDSKLNSQINSIINMVEMPFLLRAWQTLINTLDDIRVSSAELMSLEIALVKLAHLITYETPEGLAQLLNKEPRNNDNSQTHNKLNSYNSHQSADEELLKELQQMLSNIAQHGDVLLYQWLSSDVGVLKLNLTQRVLVVYPLKKNDSCLQDYLGNMLPEQFIAKRLNEIYKEEWKIELSNYPRASLVELEKARCQREIDEALNNELTLKALAILRNYKPRVDKIILNNNEIINIH